MVKNKQSIKVGEKGKKCEGESGDQVEKIASSNKRKALLTTTTTITTKTMII